MVLHGCGGLIVENDKILLIKRKNASLFDGMWTNPGGKIEPGENIEDAVVREVFEEVGVKVRVIQKISDYFHYQEGELFGIYSGYKVEVVSGTPFIREPDKFSELDYFLRINLPGNVTPFTLQYIRDLYK